MSDTWSAFPDAATPEAPQGTAPAPDYASATLTAPPAAGAWPGLPPDHEDKLVDAQQRAVATPPAAAARILNLQLKTGLPADVISRNLESVEQSAAATDFDPAKFRATSPLLATWLEQHPLHTALVKDDLIPLTALESTFGFLKDTVNRTKASLYKASDLGAWSVLEAVGDLVGSPMLSEMGRGANFEAKQRADRLKGTDSQAHGFVAEAALQGFESLGAQVPIMATAFLTGGASIAPTLTERAGLAMMAVQTGGAGYSQAREANKSPYAALNFAISQGVIEAGTEMIPFHKLVGDVAAKTGVVKTIMGQLWPEIAGEEIATALQDLNEWAVLHPELPVTDYLKARPAAFAQTAIATMIATAAQSGTAHALDRLATGPRTKQAITDLGTHVAAIKTATTSPGKFEEIVSHLAGDDARVFRVPLDKWREYWQGKDQDPRAVAGDVLGETDSYDDAVKTTGADLEIPAAKYAAKIAGTEHNAYFSDEIRLAPGLPNAREGELELAQALKAPAQDPPDPLRLKLIELFTQGGRSSVGDAAVLADLWQAGIIKLAEESGEDPVEVLNRFGLKIQRPDLPAARKAGQAAPGSTIAAPVEGAVGRPGATFLGQTDLGANYNYPLPDGTMTTGTAESVIKAGFSLPATPAPTGERLTGAELQRRAVAARDAAAGRTLDESGVDLYAPGQAAPARGTDEQIPHHTAEEGEAAARGEAPPADTLSGQLTVPIPPIDVSDEAELLTAHSQEDVNRMSPALAQENLRNIRARRQAEAEGHTYTPEQQKVGAATQRPKPAEDTTDLKNRPMVSPQPAAEVEASGPAELTEADVATFADAIKAKVGPSLKTFDVRLTGLGVLHLDDMHVERTAQSAGVGSSVMRELTAFADANGVMVTLNPAEVGYKDDGAGRGGTSSKARLVKFYQRFGFVENEGRAKRFDVAGAMYRDPNRHNVDARQRMNAAEPTWRETPAGQSIEDDARAAAKAARIADAAAARKAEREASAPFEYDLETWKAQQAEMGASVSEIANAVGTAVAMGIDPTRSDDLGDLEAFVNGVEIEQRDDPEAYAELVAAGTVEDAALMAVAKDYPVDLGEDPPAEKPTRPDGRLDPQLGDQVYQVVRGFGGSAAHILGEVYAKGKTLRVRTTGSNALIGSAKAGKTYALDENWTVVGDPIIEQRRLEREAKDAAVKFQADQEHAAYRVATIARAQAAIDAGTATALTKDTPVGVAVFDYWANEGTILTSQSEHGPALTGPGDHEYTIGNAEPDGTWGGYSVGLPEAPVAEAPVETTVPTQTRTVSYKAASKTDGSSNALRFATAAEAEAYSWELRSRWSGAPDFVFTETTDPINRRWDDEKGLLELETPLSPTESKAAERAAIAAKEADSALVQDPTTGAYVLTHPAPAESTRPPATPQVPPEPGTKYVLAPFATAQYKTPKAPATKAGTPQQVYRSFKTALTRAVNAKDWHKVIAEADRFEDYYGHPDRPFPDDWSRWQRARDDAQQKLGLPVTPTALGDKPEAETPLIDKKAESAQGGETDAQHPEAGPAGSDAGPVAASDSGAPAGRPGDARAQDVARGEPDVAASVSGPAEPAGPRKRGPRPSRSSTRPGARAQSQVQTDAGASAGAHAPGHVDTADLAPDADVAAAEARGEAPRHFQIDNEAALTEASWIDKLEANLGAIRLLKALQIAGRLATDAEQAVLARYIGWGHTNLAPVVDLREGALRERDPRVQKAREELETLLTPAELKELSESTANAHYSFNDLPRAMWAALGHMGFKGGSVLEPAVGTGHFYGTMPGPMVADKRTRLWAVEKEPIAAAIARQLYQDVHVQASPLQEANLPDNYFDVAISNVPFGRIPIFDPAFVTQERRALASSVHNYYFGKALDVVRPGGVIAFITSRYTMDSRTDVVRKFLSERADLLGAVRLPDKAFKKTAGTDVVTDILFLRKRLPGEARKGASWVNSNVNDEFSTKGPKSKGQQTYTRAVHTSEYFQAHPEQVLGEQNMSGKMARTSDPQYNVAGTVTFEQVRDALARVLPANGYKASKTPPRALATTVERDVKQGSFQFQDGKLSLYDKGTLVPSDLAGDNLARALRFIRIRDAYQTTLDVMTAGGTDAELGAAQATLRETYEAFVAEHGPVNKRENVKIIDLDPNGGRVLGLEEIAVEKVKGKQAVITVALDPKTGKQMLAGIFTERTVVPVIEATHVGTIAEGLTQSLAWKGAVDLPYIQGLTGETEAAVTTALEGQIFQDPATKAWVARDEYLSGDVTTKLAQAQGAASTDAAFAGNVAALGKVLPNQLTAEDFPAPFGATWVPVAVYKAFLQEEIKQAFDVKLTNTENRVRFYVEGSGTHEFLPPKADISQWVERALNNELPTLTKREGETVVTDHEATQIYRESLTQLRERWAEWWPSDQAADKIVKIYNGMFNRDTPYDADGSNLVLPNASPAIKLRFWQKNVIWRVLQQGNTLIAHAVGAGKTFAMVGIAGEWKRLGLANKPMIVAPNHLTEHWRREFLRLYPAARILVTSKEDFTPANRKRLVARIANNDWDAVIMAQSHYLGVSIKIETLRAYIKEQEDQLVADGAAQMNMTAAEFESLVTAYGANDKAAARTLSARNAPRSVKDIARGILTLRARLQKRLDQSKKTSPVTFEELGVDGLLVDEAHLYKNLYFSTAKNNIAGLKGSDAGRAMDMFLKVRHINTASNGRNVVFATGTPVSNAISELYTMFRYLAQPALDRMGMSGFDSWASGNAQAEGAMEPTPGGGYKEKIRLRKWSNLRELSAQFRRFTDVVLTADLVKAGELTIPKIKGGSPTVIALDAHPDMPAFMHELQDRIEALKSGDVDPKDDNNLLITTHAALAAIDLRLVKPEAAADPNSRINVAAKEIFKRYKASKKTKGVQMVFLDVGVPKVMPPLPASILGAAAVPTATPIEANEDEVDEDLIDPEADAEAAMAEIAGAGFDRDLYSDLRAQLVKMGIPDGEIAYVHQALDTYQQGKLSDATNESRIRVLIGSTAKGSTGMNVQKNLIAMHHLDVPWRPADMEQREGRILRQGNENAEVEIVRYVTKKSFDEYRWGLLATKQQSIVALMKGELTSMDDVDPAQLDMMVAQALSSGDPRTLEMLNKDREVKALQTRYLGFTRRLNAARRGIKADMDSLDHREAQHAELGPIVDAANAWKVAPTVAITHEVSNYRGLVPRATPRTFNFADVDGRKDLQAAVEALINSEPYSDSETIGRAGPFQIVLNKAASGGETFEAGALTRRFNDKPAYFLTVKVPLPGGVITIGSTPEWTVGEPAPDFRRSLDAYLNPAKLAALRANIAEHITILNDNIARGQEIAAKPFPQIDLLRKREAELHALRVALGIDAAASAPVDSVSADNEDAVVTAAMQGGNLQPFTRGALERALPQLEHNRDYALMLKAVREELASRVKPASLTPRTSSTELGADPAARRPAVADLRDRFNARKEFGQPDKGGEKRRGRIRFGVDEITKLPQTVIDLFAKADLSTLLHETGHFFLEAFGETAERLQTKDPATLNPSQKRLLDDWDQVRARFGVERLDDLTVEHHEAWATDFERYLFEGHAPSVELRSAFQRFRQWLLGVYGSIKQLGGPLSPEVKGIFDRLLASETAIAAVEKASYDDAILATPAKVGMSPQRFAQYRDAVATAGQTARERLDKKLVAEVRAKQTAAVAAARVRIETEVTTELEAQPVYRALSVIETEPMPIARAALVERFGDERVAALPEGLTSEEGADPELVATTLGFSSADELLTAIEQAPPLEEAIKAETARRVEAATTSILTDGTLYQEAQDAHANEDHDAVLMAEIKALWTTHEQNARAYERRWLEAEAKLRIAIASAARQPEIDRLRAELVALKAKARGGAATIRRALPTAKQLRQMAAERIARTTIRELDPQKYWHASRAAAKRALENAARQDLAGAAVAKEQELANLALYREARRVKADIVDRLRWVATHDTTPARSQTGLAGHDYLDQWDGMLDRFEFKRVPRKVLERRAKLADWIATQQAAGLPISLPADVLNDALRVNYQYLAVESFLGVTDGLKSLVHYARLKLTLLKAQDRRSFEDERNALATSIRRLPATRPPIEFGRWERRKRSVADAIASHATLGTIAYALDGHVYNGPFWEAIVRPVNAAADAEQTRNTEAGVAYHAIVERFYPGRDVLTFADKVYVPAIGESLSKEARLSLAQNWGNESSRDRVRADPYLKWSEDQIAAVLDTLDKRDWDFVQAHWDYLDTYWAEIAAKRERLTGLPPEKVEPVPVVTKFGTYRGGYHPLVFDARKSSTVTKQEAVSEAELAIPGAYLAQTTRRGHEIARKIDVHLPIRLDMAATTMHLSQVIHDLTHHEMLIDTQRLLRDKQVAAAIHETQGDIVYAKLSRLFSDIATGDRAKGRPTLIENGATWLRTRSQVAGLGYNVWSALQQPLGMVNGMQRVGVAPVAKGVARWLKDAASFENTMTFVTDKSPLMAGRFETASADLRDLRQTLSTDGGWFDKLVRTVSLDHVTKQTLLDSFLWMIGMSQRVADMPTWLGAYEQALTADPLDDARAVAVADQAVIDSQGGGQIKDLAEVQRGGPVAKLFMTFASYGVTVLNATGRAVGKYRDTPTSPAAALTLLGHVGMLYLVPALITEALRTAVGRADPDDELEEWMKRVASQSLTTALNGMLFVREVATAATVALNLNETGPRGYEGTAGTRPFQVIAKLAAEIHQGKLDEGLAKAALSASGIFLMYPAGQAQRMADGFVALKDGRTKNPLALVFGPPPKERAN